MDPLTLAVVAGAVLLVALLAGAALLRPRRARRPRGRGSLPPLDAPSRPLDGRDEPTGDVRVLDRPGAPPAAGPDDPDGGVALDDLDQLERLEAPPLPETPEPTAGRLARLRSRLSRAQLGRGLLALLTRERLDDATWEEVEDILLGADLGVGPTQDVVKALRDRLRGDGVRSDPDVRGVLRELLVDVVGRDLDRSLRTARHVADDRPAVVLVVGVNGTGKTTTCGKLARVLVADGRDVLLGAADTFRAAAAEQLSSWGERVGVPTVRGREGADPASVAYDAVKAGTELECDVVVVDTAGRLHTKAGLMDELGKVKRVVEKHGPVDEVLLVLDATTGQNGLAQARVFAEVVDVTGIVLTKLDGTAKGGIVVAVQRELGVPVKLVGLGEGADDLAPFDPEAFVDALLG